MSFAKEKVWGVGVHDLIENLGHFAGRPHLRIFCPKCGDFWADRTDVKYHLCGRDSCIRDNIRLIKVLRTGMEIY